MGMVIILLFEDAQRGTTLQKTLHRCLIKESSAIDVTTALRKWGDHSRKDSIAQEQYGQINIFWNVSTPL